jgi:hypothetical protein
MNNITKLDINKYNFFKDNCINELINLLPKDIIKDDVIITSNIIFNIFNFKLNNDINNYEIYKYNDDIYNLLNSSNNLIFLYQNNIYYLNKFDKILDILNSDKISIKYKIFKLNHLIKIKKNIYDYIDLLDLEKFQNIYLSEYQMVKQYNDNYYMPITYCLDKQKSCVNNIAKEILYCMIQLLKKLNYEIDPIFFYNNDINTINNCYNILEKYFTEKKYNIILKLIDIYTIYKTNSNIIYILLKNNNYLDEFLNYILNNENYHTKNILEFLLIINKVNIFDEINKKHKFNIDYNNLFSDFIKYNSLISFYYILDNYFTDININLLLTDDFLNIYIYFLKNDNINTYLFNYFKLLINNKNVIYNNQYKIIFDNIDKKTFTKEICLDFINECSLVKKYNYIKYILEINTDYKSLLYNNYILFDILDNKNEDVFNYILNLLNNEEKENLFLNLKDTDNNTLYHYICKNSLCIGMTIKNTFRNNDGFKPLDLCLICQKHYKL